MNRIITSRRGKTKRNRQPGGTNRGTKALAGSISGLCRLLAVSAMTALGVGEAGAVTYYWDPAGTGSTTGPSGGTVTGTWDASSTASWWNGTSDVVWNNSGTTDAVFGGVGGTVKVTGGTAVNVDSLTFNATGYTLGGGTGTLNLTGSALITVNNAGSVVQTATISTPLSGTVGFTKAGAGTLILSADSTKNGTVQGLTGGITIAGGMLAFDTGSSNLVRILGSSNGLTFTNTAEFQFRADISGNPGSSMAFAALTFAGGEATVHSVPNTNYSNTLLTFSSLAPRAAGATGNFVQDSLPATYNVLAGAVTGSPNNALIVSNASPFPLAVGDSVTGVNIPPPIVVSGSTTAGSNTISVVSKSGLTVGMSVSGTGIPAGELITGLGTGNTVTVTSGAGVTAASGNVIFAPTITGISDNLDGTSTVTISSAMTGASSLQNITFGLANKRIVLTNQAAGFINQGVFFNGSSYAWYDTSTNLGYVRAINYGVDPGTATLSGSTSGIPVANANQHVQLTGDVIGQASMTINTLNLSGAAFVNGFVLNSGSTLTLANAGILKSGSGSATITGGTIAAGSNELVIRVDSGSDALTIKSVISGSGGLTKSGLGTLTLSAQTPGALSFTGSATTGGSTTLQLAASSVNPTVLTSGTPVYGPGISAGTTIVGTPVANASGYTVTLSNAATANSPVPLTYSTSLTFTTDASGNPNNTTVPVTPGQAGTLAVGQIVTGANILPNTTVTAISAATGTVTLSNPIVNPASGSAALQSVPLPSQTVTFGGATVAFGNAQNYNLTAGALQDIHDTTVINSTTLTLANGIPSLVAGMSVEGSGIAPGTTIASVSGSNVTLSQPATATSATTSGAVNTYPSQVGNGSLTTVLQTAAQGATLVAGEVVTGVNIPPNTTVTSVSGKTVTFSQAAYATQQYSATVGGGATTLTLSPVQAATIVAGTSVGSNLGGVPSGTTVLSVNTTTGVVTLSNPTVGAVGTQTITFAGATNQNLTYGGASLTFGASTLVLTPAQAAALVVGSTVSGTNIPANTTITSLTPQPGGNVIATLSNDTTGVPVSQYVSFGGSAVVGINSTYGGATMVNSGTLTVGAAGLPAGGAVTVAGGATLSALNSIIPNNITLAGGNAVLSTAGGVNGGFSGAIAAGANNFYLISYDPLVLANLTISGAITGTGQMDIPNNSILGLVSNGVVTLTGNNTAFTGPVVIDNLATLSVNRFNSLNGNPVNLSGTLILALDGNGGAAYASGGNGTGAPQTLAMNNNITMGSSGTIQPDNDGTGYGGYFPSAGNKTIQLGTLSMNIGEVLTVQNNNSGSGVQFTGTASMTGGSVTFNVATATASNLVQGLSFSGQLTGGGTGAGQPAFVKNGPGTLVLANNSTVPATANNFGGGGSFIDIAGGVLSVASNAALGDSQNTIYLDNAAGATLRATGTFSTARMITLNAPTLNTIEVTAGYALTLSSAFVLPVGLENNPLIKGDNGTLILTGNNNGASQTFNGTAGGGSQTIQLSIANAQALGANAIGRVVSGNNIQSGTLVTGINTATGVVTLNTPTLGSSGSGSYQFNSVPWTGPVTINAGALQVQNSNALGSNTAGVTVARTGAALQLTNGVTVSDPMTLSGIGLGSAGALQSLGVFTNTASGQIIISGTLNTAVTIGANAGSTLNLTGGLTGLNGVVLTLNSAGTINVSSNALNPAYALTADLGSTTTLNVETGISNLLQGMSIAGPGIPAGATISGINLSQSQITISAAATLTTQPGSPQALTAQGLVNFAKTGTGTANLNVNSPTFIGAITVNQGNFVIGGSSVTIGAPGTANAITITGSSPTGSATLTGSLTLNDGTTAGSTGGRTVLGGDIANNISVAPGTNLNLSGLTQAQLAGLVVGQPVFGANIPAGTTIATNPQNTSGVYTGLVTLNNAITGTATETVSFGSNRNLSLTGGQFIYNEVAAGSAEMLGTLTSNRGATNVIQANPNGSNPLTLNFTTLTLAADSSTDFQGAGLGNGTSKITFLTTAPTLTNGLLPKTTLSGANFVSYNAIGGETLTTVSGNATITVPDTSFLLAGQAISGTGIPVGDTILTVSGGSIVLNVAANASGTNFLTFGNTNGIQAFTTFNSTNNINGAQTTDTLNLTNASTITSNFNAPKTINGFEISGGITAVDSGAQGNALTLTSGSILSTTGNNVVNFQTIAFAGTQAYVAVNGGQLTVGSLLTGTGGFVKALPGTLLLNPPANRAGYANLSGQTLTGDFSIAAGTVKLEALQNNTLTPNQLLVVAPGATLDLNGTSQFALGTRGDAGLVPSETTLVGSTLQGNAGTFTNTNSSQAALILGADNNGTTAVNFGGIITQAGGAGATSFFKGSTSANFNIANANTYSGATVFAGGNNVLLDGGTLANTASIDLDYARLTLNDNNNFATPNRVNAAAPISMRGGSLAYAGPVQAAGTQSVGAVTLYEGENTIQVTNAGGASTTAGVNSAVLTLASLSRAAGSAATVQFPDNGTLGLLGNSANVVITAAPTLTQNIIGPWAIAGREFASYIPVLGVGALNQSGFAGYSANYLNLQPLATDNIRTTLNTALAVNTTVNTLNVNTVAVNQNASITIDLGGNTLTLAGNGLILSENNSSASFSQNITIQNGSITSGTVNAGGDLYVHALNFSGGVGGTAVAAGVNSTFVLSANITNNGTGAVRLVKDSGFADGATDFTMIAGTSLNFGGNLLVGAGTTAGSNTVTVASVTGISVGMTVTGLGIPAGETVTGLSGNNVTISTGSGVTAMATNNTYSGGTVINGGTLIVGPGGNIPAGGITISGGETTGVGLLSQTAGGVIAPTNTVTINGLGALTLSGNNTLTGLIFNGDGAGSTATATAPTVTTFGSNTPLGTGLLTLGGGGITATPLNPAAISTVVGRLDFGVAPSTVTVNAYNLASNVSGFVFTDFAPTTAGLILQGLVGSGGGITKAGAGVLQFNAQDVFTGPLNVTAGTVQMGIANGGSRFSQLNLSSATSRLNLNGLSTTFGSLAGSGIITSTGAAATLTVGFDNTSTTFSGQFSRFNDATPSAVSLTKIGSGTLTIASAQSATNGSSGGVTVNGGGLTYSGAGAAYPSTSLTAVTYNVNSGGTITLDNTAGNIATGRLGLNTQGTLNLAGGTLVMIGNPTAGSNESINILNFSNGNTGGGGTIQLTGSPGGPTTITVTGSISAQNGQDSGLVTGNGLNGTGAGSVNVFVSTLTGSVGAAGSAIRPDLLGDTTGGSGTGFLTRDTSTGGLRPLLTTELDPDMVTASVTGNNSNTGLTSANNATGNLLLTNAVVSNETGNNTVNSLTLYGGGTPVLGSGLGVSAGVFAPNAVPLTLTVGSGGVLALSNATIGVGEITSGSATQYYHVVGAGVTLTVNSSIIASTAGIVKADAGTLVLNARQYYTGAIGTNGTTVNGGTLQLNAGNNTLLFQPGFQAAATTISPALSLFMNGGTLDLYGTNQVVERISNNNPIAGSGGTIINSSVTQPLVTLTSATATATTFAGSIGSGVVGGSGNGINFTKSGNSVLTLTSVNSYTGTTVLRGGGITLQDSGTLATGAVTDYFGTLLLNEAGLNPQGVNPVRIPAAAPITLNGGTIQQSSGGSLDANATFNTVNLASGGSIITQSTVQNAGSSATINIGSLVQQSSAATVSFAAGANLGTLGGGGLNNSQIQIASITPSGGSATAPASLLANGILPAWITVNGTDFAGYLPAAVFGSQGVGALGTANYPAYSTAIVPYSITAALPAGTAMAAAQLPANATSAYNLSVTATVLPIAGRLVNSAKITGTTIIPVNLPTDTLSIGSGGLLVASGSATVQGGLLTGGSVANAPGALYATATGTLTINSQIVNNGNQTFSANTDGVSNVITVGSTSGLAVNQIVNGPGIPANSTITAITSPTTFTIALPTTAASFNLTDPKLQSTNTTTISGNTTVTLTGANVANLALGMFVSGPGILPGTTLTALGTAASPNSVTLSSAPTATMAPESYYATVGNSITTLNMPVAQGATLTAKMTVSGANVPGNTTISSVTPANLNATGNTTASSNQITGINTAGLFVGMSVAGPGIPAGELITAITGNTVTMTTGTGVTAGTGSSLNFTGSVVTLSQQTTGPQGTQLLSFGATLSFARLGNYIAMPVNTTATNGTTTATVVVNNFTGLVVGMPVSGPGIPAGTVISSFGSATNTTPNSTTVYLTAPTNFTSLTTNSGINLVFGTGISVGNGTAGAESLVKSGTGTLTLTPQLVMNGSLNGTTSVTVPTTAGLLPGMTVTGTGIPAGTTIASITGTNTYVLSQAATASSASAASTQLAYGPGTASFPSGLANTAFSNTYTGGTFVNQGTLSLAGFAGTTVIPGDMTINNATVSTLTTAITAATVTAGSSTITLPNVTGLSTGMTVAGNGIPAGEVITGINTATNAITLSTGTNVVAGSSVALTFGNPGQIINTGNVTINGGGTLNLFGANTLGSIAINGSGGNTAPTVALGTTGTLTLTNGITSVNDNLSFTPIVSGTNSVLALPSGAAITTSGASLDNLLVTVPITPVGALTKVGPGSLILTPAIAMSATTVAGTATFTVPNVGGLSVGMAVTGTGIPAGESIAAINPATNTITLTTGTGVTAASNSTLTFAGNTFSGGTSLNGGSLIFTQSTNQLATNASAAASSTATIGVASTTGLAAGMAVSGTGIPAGEYIASLSSPNIILTSATGVAVAANAVLTFAGANTVLAGPAGAGPINMADGTAMMSDGVALRVIGNAVNIAGGATFGPLPGNGTALALNGLTLTGPVTLTGGGAHTITVPDLPNVTTISGQLSGGGSSLTLTKAGTGTLVLSNPSAVGASTANTYTGSTTFNVAAGVLRISGPAVVPAGLNLSVSPGAVYDINGQANQFISTLSNPSPGTAGNGGLVTNSSGTATTLFVGGTSASDPTTNVSNSYTFDGMLSASSTANLTVTKVGGGTQVLNGSSNYTGATTVAFGTLTVNGALGATNVTVNGGATLSGTGSIGVTSVLPGSIFQTAGGSVTIAGGISGSQGTLSLVNKSLGTFTINTSGTGTALTVGSGAGPSILSFDIGNTAGANNSTDQIIIGGSGVLKVNAAGETVNFTQLSGTTLGSGIYNLITFANYSLGTGVTAANAFTLGTGAPNGSALTLTTSALILDVGGVPLSFYWTGAKGSIWNTTSAGTNWSNAQTGGTDPGQVPNATSIVNFNATGGTNVTTTLGASFTIDSLNFLSTSTSPVTIGGTSPLTVNNNVTLNSGTAAVTISTSGLVLGSAQSWINQSASNLTVSAPVSGTSALSISSSSTGKVILSGNNSGFGGGITVTGNQTNTALQLGSTGVTPLGTGPFVMNNGALDMNGQSVTVSSLASTANTGIIKNTAATTTSTLSVVQTGTTTYSGVLQDSGTGKVALLVDGGGTLQLTTPVGNTVTGTTTAGSSTVVVSSASGLYAGMMVTGATIPAGETIQSISGTTVILTTGAGVTAGTGTSMFMGNISTYSGGTTINNATLRMGNGGSEIVSSLGTGPVVINTNGVLNFAPGSVTTTYNIPNTITLNGGQIQSSGGNQHLLAVAANAAGGTITPSTATGQDLYLDGLLTGSGSLAVGGTGTGKVILTNNGNTYNGTLTSTSAGNLQLAGTAATSTALANANLVNNGTTASGLSFGSSVTAVTLGSLAGTGTFALQNTAATPVAVALTVGGNNATTSYLGNLTNSGTALGTLTKVGTGTFTLGSGSASYAANTYHGATSVSGGTFLVNSGSTTASVTGLGPVSVTGTATLGGNGVIQGGDNTAPGSVTLASGTFLSPGLTAGAFGTLRIGVQTAAAYNTTLNLNSGSTYQADVGSGSSSNRDLVSVAGSVVIGATATLAINAVSPDQGSYTLLTATGTISNNNGTVSGANPNAFANFTGVPTGYSVVSTATTVSLQHLPTIGSITAPTGLQVITGGSLPFTFTVQNSAPSGSGNLSFTAGSPETNVTGSVSTPVVVTAGTTGNGTGLSFNSVGLPIGAATSPNGSFTVSATGATNASVTANVSVDILGHAAPATSASGGTFTGGTITMQPVRVGYVGPVVSSTPLTVFDQSGFRVNLAGSAAAPIGNLSLSSIGGAAGAVTAGSSASITASLATGQAAGTFSQAFTYSLSDDSTLPGNNSATPTNVTINVAGSVYNGQGLWGTTGGGSWGTFSQWTTTAANPGGYPGLDGAASINDTATFGSNLGTGTVTLDGGTGGAVSPLLSALTFTGNSGTIAQGAGSGTLTLQNNQALVAPTITVTGGSPIISAPLVFANTVTVNTTGATDALLISGVISGPGGLTKIGAGMLTLSNTNTYSGTTAVNGGTLSVASQTNLSSNQISIDNGATLQTTGNTTLSGTQSITVGSGGGTLNVATGTTLTLTAPISGIITGTGTTTGTITKTGAGTLSFLQGSGIVATFPYATPSLTLVAGTLTPSQPSGTAYINTGPLNFNGGTLAINVLGNGGQGATAGNDFINAGVVAINAPTALSINLGGYTPALTDGPFTFLNGGGVSPTLNAYFTVNNLTTQNNNSMLIGSSSFQVAYNTANNGNISLNVVPVLSWTGAGLGTTGTQTITGSPGGTSFASGGTVLLNGTSPSLNSLTFSGVNATVMQGSGGTLTLSGTTPSITANSGGTGTFNISAPISLASNATITATTAPSLPALGDVLGLWGPISSTGTFGLTLNGQGTIILGGVNTYTGPTNINVNTLQFTDGRVFGTNTVTLGANADMIYTGSATSGPSTTLANLIAGSTSGTGSLAVSGTGTLALTNTGNTFVNPVNVNSGTLQFINGNTNPTGPQSLGESPTVTLGVNGTSSGKLAYVGTAAATLAKTVSALGNGGDTIMNSSSTAGALLTISGQLNKDNKTLTLVGGSQGIKVTGPIIGTTVGTSDLNIGGGVTTVSSTSNTYSGPTTLLADQTPASTLVVTGSLSGSSGVGGTTALNVNSGGTMVLASATHASNIIGVVTGTSAINYASVTVNGTATPGTPVNLTGGASPATFAVNAGNSGTTQTFAALKTSGNAVLDFSSTVGGPGTANTGVNLVFTSLSLSGTLTVNNWAATAQRGQAYLSQVGSPTASDPGALGDGQDRLLFNTDPGFTIGQAIPNILFNGYAGMEVSFGAQYEIVPVPEPATAALIGSVALCALLGCRRRSRFVGNGSQFTRNQTAGRS